MALAIGSVGGSVFIGCLLFLIGAGSLLSGCRSEIGLDATVSVARPGRGRLGQKLFRRAVFRNGGRDRRKGCRALLHQLLLCFLLEITQWLNSLIYPSLALSKRPRLAPLIGPDSCFS